jgi:anti-sigma factor RsiW
MDCREFREKHGLYIDELCSDLDAFEMRSHMRFCPECDRHDTVVRRGMLLVRNLPSIRPSPQFQARLYDRIRAESLNRAIASGTSPRLTQWVSLAAAVAVLAFGVARIFATRQADIYRMAPVVASKPLRASSPFGTSALVATVPTGMSIWPAIVMASQAPSHLAATELASER